MISDGGIVSCDLAILGRVRIHQIASDPVPVFRDEPWAGYLYLTGSGSEFQVLDTLHAGNGGHAEINIFLGGKISAGSQVEITGLNPGYGGSIYIGSSSVLQSPQVNVREFGHLLGSGTVIGNVNNLGGHVAPGFSPGTSR